MILGANTKKLVILIPKVGNECPNLLNERRIINQPYAPQNVEVNVGTTIRWVSGDVDHNHKITLEDELEYRI